MLACSPPASRFPTSTRAPSLHEVDAQGETDEIESCSPDRSRLRRALVLRFFQALELEDQRLFESTFAEASRSSGHEFYEAALAEELRGTPGGRSGLEYQILDTGSVERVLVQVEAPMELRGLWDFHLTKRAPLLIFALERRRSDR